MENQQKHYNWAQDSQWTLSGVEFGILYRLMTGMVSDPQFQQSFAKVSTVMDIVTLAQICQGLLNKGIEDGIAKPVENE